MAILGNRLITWLEFFETGGHASNISQNIVWWNRQITEAHGQLTARFRLNQRPDRILAGRKIRIVAVTGRWHDSYLPPKTLINNDLFGKTFNVFRHVKLYYFLERHAARQLVVAVPDQGLRAESGRGHSRPIFEDPAKMFDMLDTDFFSN